MKLMYLLILALTESALMQTCPHGYVQNKMKACEDYDECENEDLICGDNAECFNTNGSYYCQCHEGFKPPGIFTANDSIKCQDINECLENKIDCGFNAKCINVDGNYTCVCNMGYTPSTGAETFIVQQGVECIDRNECQYSDTCGKNASCHNTPGDHYCTCAPGFRLKSGGTNFTGDTSESCESVCDTDASICGGGSCKIGKDGHECVCKSGFTNYGHKESKCTELMCNNFIRDSSQAHPELREMNSLMTNSCLLLNENTSVQKSQVDAETILEAFLDALDKLLRGSFQADNRKVSAIFGIVEDMLKLIGALLKNHQTRRSAIKTDVELLVKRGVSPPEGPLMISTNRTQFNSHWKTATGKTYLGFSTAALLGYKKLEESLNSYFDHLKRENIRYKINSKVVTVTVSNTETNKLEEQITLTFSHLEHRNESHICVFWDPELNGGAWSSRGCTKVKSNVVETVCSCDHLSTFAVLMALYDIGDIYELRIITYVGLSLSMICLLICIATFYLVRSIQSTRNTIHLHLCITLFIAYFIFLVGITRTENEVGCAIVAGTLHYFFLAAFCWMCLEGVQLFRMVVLVFNTTVRHIHLIAAGYGVPAVIVVVSAIVNSKGYGTEHHCWLNIEDEFIWSFYGPVCIIIIVNVFFFLITIWKLAEKFSSLNPDLNNLRKIRTFTITAIAQLCVLGIMWVFGCFQFDQGTLAMSYIFTILGSLQGVLMFILHCWLSKQVREEYVTFLSSVCAPHKRKYSEFNSQQTSKSQTSKSVQNTGESSI